MAGRLAHLKFLPTSRAKTAYGLLSEVCRVILAEPKRYDQGTFMDALEAQPSYSTKDYPKCGTMCCVGGWVATLKNGRTCDWGKVETTATTLLGLTDEEATELFDGGALHFRLSAEGDNDMPLVGTHAYAELGVRHIRAFMAAHANQLKRKRV